ncbi:MAG: hypothetical protein KY464_03005 [Gemmatimonadetes bacterium]|nr:hypothetical protein [Gemmatimonadota bacterium]
MKAVVYARGKADEIVKFRGTIQESLSANEAAADILKNGAFDDTKGHGSLVFYPPHQIICVEFEAA